MWFCEVQRKMSDDADGNSLSLSLSLYRMN